MLSHKKHKKEISDKFPFSVYIITLVLIIDLLGFTVILPLLPSIFDHYNSNKEDFLYHWMQQKVSYFQKIFGAPEYFHDVLFGGILGSLFSFLQFFMAPISGSLSDVYGRKLIFIFSMIGIALSHAIWSSANYFYIFVLARIIGGISRTTTSLSAAIVTDLCSEKLRSTGMALIGIAFSIGFIVGPIIGAIFSSYAHMLGKNFYVLPAYFALMMSILDIILLIFCFQESLPKNKRALTIGRGLSQAYQFISPPSLFTFSPVQKILPRDLKKLQQIGIIYFLFLFFYSGLEYSLSFLTHTRFAFTSMQQGKMYLFSGIIMICVQGGLVRRIPPGKETKLVALGALLIIPGFIIIGLSQNISMLYCGLALYAFASASVVPGLTIIASKIGTSDQKGVILGIFRSLGSLARALGPFTFAVAYWSLTPQVSYCIGGILLFIPLILILKLKQELGEEKASKIR